MAAAEDGAEALSLEQDPKSPPQGLVIAPKPASEKPDPEELQHAILAFYCVVSSRKSLLRAP